MCKWKRSVLSSHISVNSPLQLFTVITAHEHKCNAHAPISLPLDTGYLSSFVTMTTGRGNPDCPWRIRVHPGQHVNITLINFARVGLPTDWELPASTRPKICYQLACIRERQHTRTLTECEGSARLTHAYTSTSNLVEIDIIVAKVLNVYFLLHYKGDQITYNYYEINYQLSINYQCTTLIIEIPRVGASFYPPRFFNLIRNLVLIFL